MNNAVKPPKMGAVSKVFAGMEVVDGIKKTRDEFRNTNNIYDDKLGVNMKGHKPPKLASEELDELMKIAGVGGWTGKTMAEALKRGVRDFDADTAKNVAGAISSAKNKQFGKALKSGAKALPGVALNAGAAIGAGVGTTKALNALDKKNTDENKMAHKIIGATVGAGLAATALTGGGISQGMKIIKDSAKDKVVKHIPDQYAKSHATFSSVKDIAKQTAEKTNKAVKQKSALGKNADKMINDLDYIIHNDNPKKKKDLLFALNDMKNKEMRRVRNSVYRQNPKATDSDVMSAWLKSKERKDFMNVFNEAKGGIRRMSKEAGEELDTLIKLAGINMGDFKSAVKPIISGAGKAGVYVGDKIITPALTAMSTTAAPIIATTLLSQKMLNQSKGEKADGQQGPAPQPQTLVIKVDNGTGQQVEKTAAIDDQSHDIGNVLSDVVKNLNEIKGAEKLRTEKVHVGNGRKKLFQMQQQHGMDGMQP